MGSPSCDSWIDSIESVDSRIDPLAEIMSDRGFATGSKRLMGSVEKLLKLCYEADQEAPGGIQPKSTDPYRNVSTDEECDCDPRQFSRITLCTSRWPKCSAGLDIVSPLQRLEAAARGAAKASRMLSLLRPGCGINSLSVVLKVLAAMMRGGGGRAAARGGGAAGEPD